MAVLARPPEPFPPPVDLVPYPENWPPFFSTPSLAMPPRPSALIAALTRGDEGEVRRLLADGADPSAPWGHSEPSLAIAIRQGSLPLVRLLLEHGADASGAVPSVGATLLQLAARQGNRALAAALVEAGADVGWRFVSAAHHAFASSGTERRTPAGETWFSTLPTVCCQRTDP